MKTPLTLLTAAALSGLAFAQNSTTADSAALERQPVERWLGDWAYQTTVHQPLLGNAGTTLGSRSVHSLKTGPLAAFASMDIAQGEPAHQVESDGLDPTRGTFFWSSLTGNSPVTDPTYSFDGPRVTMVGTILAGGQRYTLRSLVTFADDFQSFTDRREISTDGIHWTLLSESSAAKITPVLAAPDADEQERDAMENDTMENERLPNSMPAE